MDRSIITLLGVVDVLEVLIQEQKPGKNFNPKKALQSVRQLRRELTEESIRHSRRVGRARDMIEALTDQLTVLSQDNRDALWTLQGVRTAETQSVEPPPLPPRSSSGPQ